MTKADLVSEVAKKTGIERSEVLSVIESMMVIISDRLVKNENVYLRGFGSFVTKHRAQKVARNISKDEPMIIPEHRLPAFRPSQSLIVRVKREPVKDGNHS